MGFSLNQVYSTVQNSLRNSIQTADNNIESESENNVIILLSSSIIITNIVSIHSRLDVDI